MERGEPLIFISYRQEDAEAEVTHLYRWLAERFGEDRIFVDYRNIPPGEPWPDVLRQRLLGSCVLLAVIGPQWGSARFKAGKNNGRLRLDDPEDWVRQEICTAIREKIRVVPLLVDDAALPETEWRCELDQLRNLQHLPLRNQGDFEGDVGKLCDGLEASNPELRRIAQARRTAPPALPPSSPEDPARHNLRHYLASEIQRHASLQLPLVAEDGNPVIAPLRELRIDLPLIVSHEHRPQDREVPLLWLGSEVLAIHDQLRRTYTSAVLVDRASRFEDIPRDCDIGTRLTPGSRSAVVGDPGCGKSTLLRWIAHHYSERAERSAGGAGPATAPAQSLPLPDQDWLPLLILCSDLVGAPLPGQLAELLRSHLRRRQLSEPVIATLVPSLEELLDQGRALLLIDGLDEIPDSEQRVAFCRLLNAIAERFPQSPIVVTSRVVGFQAVRDELASTFDHLLVAPLDQPAKRLFIARWSGLIGWDQTKAEELIQQVCYSRVTAKLTDNIFLLAMIAQIKVLDRVLPGRRIDVFRRAVQLMIQRRRAFPGPPLSANEVIPHLELLAYRMRKQGVQRCVETEALAAFRAVRQASPEEPALHLRSPEELLQACIDSLGLLNVAGAETDRRGFERRVVQFFHQSFQEYFAGQAINHGHDGAADEGVVARLRTLLATLEIREREVIILGRHKVVEPVIADYWQEAVRLAIADLQPGEADDAILMLLPDLATEPRESRSRAVFALQCLADEPAVGAPAVASVFDAVVECLEENDGFDTKLNTWMDEALAAVAQSRLGEALRDRLVEGFIESHGERRDRLGRCALVHPVDQSWAVTPENAEGVIASAVAGLAAARPAERIWAALELVERCFQANGLLGFMTPAQQETLVQALLEALDREEPLQCAAMWALCWLTGARNRRRGSLPESAPALEFVLLDPAKIERIETILRRPGIDINTLAAGCLVLNRERGLDLLVHQADWIYDLAVIADGGGPRRDLSPPGPVGRSAPADWMQELLQADLPKRFSRRIAQALGAFGCFCPEMVPPLESLFLDNRGNDENRDEALIYLAWIGTPEAVAILIAAADTPPLEKDDYLYARGLFGLLSVDDVDVLAEQIRKALPHSDLKAYAYGLAGSLDPRGRSVLEQLKDHPTPEIREAVAAAFARPWMADAG